MITFTEVAEVMAPQFYEFECEQGRPLERMRDGSREYYIIALPAETTRNEERRLVSNANYLRRLPPEQRVD